MWRTSGEPQEKPTHQDGYLYRAEIDQGPDTAGRPVWIEASGSLGPSVEMARQALVDVLRDSERPPRKVILQSPPDETFSPPYRVRVEYE
jgi:hypothetical protein